MKPDPFYCSYPSLSFNSAHKYQRPPSENWPQPLTVTEFKAAQDGLPRSGQGPKVEARLETFQNQ